MKLKFNLLVIDDNPDDLPREALDQLKEFLLKKGFSLIETVPPDISPEAIGTLSEKEGSDFDLVIIDYRLGVESHDGSTVAKTFRTKWRYTDIVFYSSATSVDLLKALAEQKVAGVFVASRTEDLGDALVGVAQTIIGKAVDLTHMRGIALAEVADMEAKLQDLLVRAFSSNHPAVSQLKCNTH